MWRPVESPDHSPGRWFPWILYWAHLSGSAARLQLAWLYAHVLEHSAKR